MKRLETAIQLEEIILSAFHDPSELKRLNLHIKWVNSTLKEYLSGEMDEVEFALQLEELKRLYVNEEMK